MNHIIVTCSDYNVVANEIKVLAKHTADQTLKIQIQISDIQNSTVDSVNIITDI